MGRPYKHKAEKKRKTAERSRFHHMRINVREYYNEKMHLYLFKAIFNRTGSCGYTCSVPLFGRQTDDSSVSDSSHRMMLNGCSWTDHFRMVVPRLFLDQPGGCAEERVLKKWLLSKSVKSRKCHNFFIV